MRKECVSKKVGPSMCPVCVPYPHTHAEYTAHTLVLSTHRPVEQTPIYAHTFAHPTITTTAATTTTTTTTT